MDMMMSSDKGEHDIIFTNSLNDDKIGLNDKNAHIKFGCWHFGYDYVLLRLCFCFLLYTLHNFF